MRPVEQPIITEAQIGFRVAELAGEISRDFGGDELVLLVVLKGGFMFAGDLARHLRLPVSIEFVRAKSYVGDKAIDPVALPILPERKLHGCSVLLVEDILDTGRTTAAILTHLRSERPARTAICTLLDKPSKRVTSVQPDYVGFTVEDQFVVGYGLDYNERYRELPAIHALKR